ncbi:hypothetical protein F4778DRAFT_739883 [Xylariomycetidae sp. FL2044]|nr:hypothetical protein F4778DRAFT_739883 [Xylariomycetidae sp. FL2044]
MPQNSDTVDEGDNNHSYNPFAWVLIPLVVFAIVSALFTGYRYRRRRRLRMLYGAAALSRDIEAMRPQDRSAGPHAQRRPRRGGRLGLGNGMGSREDGLNEFGEAPPAYSPATKQGEGEGLSRLAGPNANSGQTGHATPEATNAQGLPTYNELQQPPRAHLSTT